MTASVLHRWTRVLGGACLALHQIAYSRARKSGLDPMAAKKVASVETGWLEQRINARIEHWNAAQVVSHGADRPSSEGNPTSPAAGNEG